MIYQYNAVKLSIEIQSVIFLFLTLYYFRSLYKKGNYNEALVNILQALEIYPHNEVQALAIKINKKIEGS